MHRSLRTLILFQFLFAAFAGISNAQLISTPNPFTVSNTVISVGQYSTFNAVISGGLGSLIGNWSWAMAGGSVGNVIGSAGVSNGVGLATWGTTNSLSKTTAQTSCVSYNNYIYCLAGYTGSYITANVQSAQIYSGTNVIGTWGTTNSLLTGVGYLSCVAYDGYIYCPGGQLTSGFSAGVSTVQSAQIYSGTNVIGAWGTTNSLLTGVWSHSCVAYNSYIYCMGGYTGSYVSGNVQSAQIYSGTNVIGTWGTTNSLSKAIQYNSCVAYNSYIYCLGGDGGSGAISTVQSAQIYSGTNVIGAWGTTNSLATAVYDSSCVVYNSYIYCMGGTNSGGSTIATVQYAQIYSGTNVIGAWHATNSLSSSVVFDTCVTYNSYIYCPGGHIGGTTTVQSTNILTQEVTPNQPLPMSNNAITVTVQAVSSTTVNVMYAGNTFTVTASGTNTIYGVWDFSAFAQDSTGANSITVTNTLTIGQAVSVSISSTSPTLPTSLDVGQTETFNALATGGSGSYTTYNFLVFNIIAGNPIQVGNYLTATNNFVYTIPAAEAGNVLFTNVVVTDTNSGSANSVLTGGLNIYSAPSISITPSSTSVTPGQAVTFTVTVTGGLGPFTIELYNITGGMQQGSNVIVQNPGGGNTISLTTGSTGTFSYNAIATDQGVTPQLTFNSISTLITVSSATTTVTPPCTGGCTHGSGGSGVLYTTLQTTTMSPSTTISTGITSASTTQTTTTPVTTIAVTTQTQNTTASTSSATTTTQGGSGSSQPNIFQQIWNWIVNFFSHL